MTALLPVLALVALAWAEAPECPEGAVTAPLHETQVRILAVGPHDPYRLVADTLVGTAGRFSRTDLVGDCWQRGWFEQPNGERSYFTQVAVVEEPACPEDARRSGLIPLGTWLEVTALHPRDAHFDNVDQVVGTRGIADSPLMSNEACWYSGRMRLKDEQDLFFLKAAFREWIPPEIAWDLEAKGCPPDALKRAPAHRGEVTIAAIHPEDAYYDTRSTVVGITGHFDGGHVIAGCWIAGAFTTLSGEYFYFFKAAVVPSVGVTRIRSQEPEAVSALFGELGPAQAVQIDEIHIFDPLFEERDALRGQLCLADGDLTEHSRGWYAGGLTCDSGKVTFERVRLLPPAKVGEDEGEGDEDEDENAP